MMYPLVLDLAADGIAVAVTCRVLGFTTQAFCKWRKNPVPQREFDAAQLIDAALDIHADDPTFGYRFIADELTERGIAAGRTGSPGCAARNGSGRSTPRSEAEAARPVHRCMTTW
jgi:hypothetical protein